LCRFDAPTEAGPVSHGGLQGRGINNDRVERDAKTPARTECVENVVASLPGEFILRGRRACG